MMQEKNNATCSICGKEYYKCLSCRDSINLTPWKIHCCSAECYKVFQVVRGFSTGVYIKNEFRSKLKNINLSNLENYREHIKVLIKDVLKEKPVEKAVEKVEELIIEDKADAIAAEEVVIEKPVVSRKRNYKVEAEETE